VVRNDSKQGGNKQEGALQFNAGKQEKKNKWIG